MRLDAVEIKVTVDGAQVRRGRQAFGLEQGGHRRLIYFCEEAREDAPGAVPLLDAGVVLRARAPEDSDGDGDSTVKLRPCRRSQLTRRWLGAVEGDGWVFRVEDDWAGDRRVLAASYTADRPARRVARVRAGHEPLRRLFSPAQRRFLADCGDLSVDLDGLTLLPPVRSTRWGPVRKAAGDSEFSIMAERWVVDTLDFLELSIRVAPDVADESKAGFEELVRAHGLRLDSRQETKTRRVLELLVRQPGSG
jgi:hypothetical protein